MRRAAITGTVLAAAALAMPAGAAGADYAAGKNCEEQQAFVDGDAAEVARRLPAGYTAMTDPANGRPVVFARGLRCRELTLGGRTASAVSASIGVLIDTPDGRGCGSAIPGAGSVKGDNPPVCNWYVLRWLSSDRRVVDWLRHETPGFPAVHVPELVFDLGTFDPARGGAPFSFSAAGPAPFTIDAVARENPREVAVRGGYWVDTPQGTVKIALSSDDLVAGDGDGVVRAPGGSELAALMGAEERSYAPPFDGFASVRATHGVYRKQILPPDGSTDGFAGSCALEGTVTFKPTPANNETRPLSSDFTGTATCTGRLDGREVKDAPASVYQSGRAEGGCRSAKTVAPWHGTMRFESGEVLRYTLDFTTQSTAVSGTIYGERSGTAPGSGSFLTERTSPDVTVRCAGEGVTETSLDFSFTTHSALVNEPSVPAAPRRSLRLAASPRTVGSGRRTTFTFRATTAGGEPVAGAFVRFFGRRVRTGPSGTARIVATLRGHGAHPASAKMPGHRGARATVRVRR